MIAVKIIQITNTYQGEVLQLVRSCVPGGFVIRTLPENTEQALLECIADADYILASGRVKITRRVLQRAEKVKMLQRTGVGLDALDLSALSDHGIPVYVNQGINAQSVAEHTLLLMLACLRRLPELSENTRNGIWIKQAQGVKTRELNRCTVGVLGMGNIGRTVTGLLRAFGAQVCYYDAFRLPPEQEQALGAEYLPVEELCRRADILTLHCPLTDQTRGVICRERLNTMKPGVILINTARGGLICEADLLAALEEGRVACAGLDVFESEPPKNTALLRHPRVIVTPHIAGVTRDSFYQMMHDAMRNIRLFDEGKLSEIQPYKLDQR